MSSESTSSSRAIARWIMVAAEYHAAGIDLPIMVATAARVGDGVGPFATVEGVGRLLVGAAA